MSNSATLNLDDGKLSTDAERLTRRYLAAGTAAVGTTTRRLEQKLEAATQAAAGGKLWRAWQSSAFPKSGPARNPVGTIWIKGGTRTRGAIRYWTEPGQARGKGGKYFAIPLPAAGSRGRDRLLTPDEWEARTGQTLRPVFRPGRAPLLVADDAVLSGKGQIAKGNTARRIATGRASATVPIFVLVPLIRFRGAVSVEGLIRAAERELPQEYVRAVRAVSS